MAQSAVVLSIGTCEKEKKKKQSDGVEKEARAWTLLPHNEGI